MTIATCWQLRYLSVGFSGLICSVSFLIIVKVVRYRLGNPSRKCSLVQMGGKNEVG